jgi:pantothenate kinase-related protein Tda10
VGKFKGLRTVDRSEIESYQSIRNLMKEYIAKENPKTPLCMAVFGPPGSGKSFGVNQLPKAFLMQKLKKWI